MIFPLLNRNIIIRLLPMMDRLKVSTTARGRRVSTVTNEGFLEVYLSGRSLNTAATRRQSWAERREDFLKRHIRQGHPLFDEDGHPTRYHLALVAWSYSPDVRGLRAYIKRARLKNRLISRYLGND